MPSTRKQKAREKRFRQSDGMSDIENLDFMLGKFQENDLVRDENVSEAELDSESRIRQRGANMIEGNFRNLLNTNVIKKARI